MRTTARSKNLFYDSYYEVKQIMPATGWQMLIGEPTVYIGDDGEEEDGGMDYRLSPVYALALARIEPPEDPSEWDCPRYHIYKHLYDENGSLAGWDIVGMVYSPNCGWSVANRALIMASATPETPVPEGSFSLTESMGVWEPRPLF